MTKKDYKIIKDNVHGYIRIPKDYVENFVDTDIFQRLRNIEQTGMRTLYPAARHDRFIHSLGTFHLGCKAFKCFRDNVRDHFSKTHFKVLPDSLKNEKFWDRCGVLFEIACLLHDCAHAPFSHALEFYYEHEKLDPDYVKLKDKLNTCIGSSDFHKDFQDEGVPHERMSALMVCSEFGDAIQDLIFKRELLLSEDADEVEFIIRMIIGCEYKKTSKKNQIKNCLINLLNSSSIDVDSLDYIIRDSKQSGIENMAVDIERLLGSLTLVETTNFSNKEFRESQIDTNILNGRLVKTNKAAYVKGIGKGAFLSDNVSGIINGFLSLRGQIKVLKEMKLQQANNNIIKVGDTPMPSLPITNEPANIEIYGATKDELNFESGRRLKLKDEFNGRVELEADEFEFVSTYINAKLKGKFSGNLLGDYTRLGGELRCQLGFHKSSLSVIQNVIVARNYEYQWIYSHHKVAYYANYLIVELLRLCVKHILSPDATYVDADKEIEKILSWETMIKHSSAEQEYHFVNLGNYIFFRPTDSDFIALFKKCRIDFLNGGNSDNQCRKLLEEYFTRVYRKSLWKSYAEFNILFNDFSFEEKKNLRRLIISNTKINSCANNQYGYLNDEWQCELTKYGMDNVIWVNADSKLKSLDADNTFILFRDATLTYRTVSSESEIKLNRKPDLFFLYYDINDDIPVNADKLKEFIREKLKDYPMK